MSRALPPTCWATLQAPLLTAVAAVGAGDELLRPLVAVLLLGPQAEAADGDGLRHRLEGQGGVGVGGERKSRMSVGFNGINCAHVAQVCV